MENHELYKSTWVPPHCPSPSCKYHNDLQSEWRFKRMGYFYRKAQPTRIRRFRCLHCGVTFSSQTFSTTYWLKKPHIISQLLTKVTGGMCNSQIASDLAVSPATVDRQIYRLGRHCLLFHKQMMKAKPLFEKVNIDSIVTFEYSQYHPYHLHLALDKVSTSMTINAPAAILLAMYIAVARQQGVDVARLRGTVQNDILKEYVGRGTWVFPVEPSIKLIGDTIEFCAQRLPKYSPVSVCGYHIRESGANPAQEMAYGLAIACRSMEM